MKFGNSPPVIAAPTREQQAELAALDSRLGVFESYFKDNNKKLDTAQRAWERALSASGSDYWFPVAGLQPIVNPRGDFPREPGRVGTAYRFDGKGFLDAGDVGGFDIEDRFTLATWLRADGEGDGSLISRTEDKPKGKGYGIHLNHGKVQVELTSTYADDAIRLRTEQPLAPARWHHVAVSYDGMRMAEGVQVYVDGVPAKVEVEQNSLYRPFRNNSRALVDPLRIGSGWGPERRFRGLLDDVRVYSRVLSSEEVGALATGESIEALAQKPQSRRSDTDRFQLHRYFLEHAAPGEARHADAQRTALLRDRDEMTHKFPTVMVMAERPERKDTFILQRGAYNMHGDKVNPGVPAVLSPLPSGVPKDAPRNRLGFAEWLVSPQNPLLARVTVNRFWQLYFGTGLVKTTEDFGRQGEWPSHPELLDWLATDFIENKWDVKRLQKLIVTSAAYRQSSAATPELIQRDPENRLLARGPRYRLPAEMIRDQALSAAGLLVEKVGGPSVKPYQPAGLWKEISMQDMDYTQGTGADLYRRSLYTFWKRTVAPPMQANFDSAMRESCVVRDSRTNTPLQALNLMNDITFVEAARFLGQRMLTEAPADPERRLSYGFQLATGRKPNATEAEILRSNLQYHLDFLRASRRCWTLTSIKARRLPTPN